MRQQNLLKKSYRKSLSAFTLIELLVVIGIVVLVTAGSIVGISSSTKIRQVKTSADKLNYLVSEAISEAKTPNEDQFGLVKIRVVVTFNVGNSPDEVNGYYCYSDACNTLGTDKALAPKLTFKAPKGIYLFASTAGNMLPENPGNANNFYFGISATGNNIGQISEYNHNANQSVVLFKVLNDPVENNASQRYEVKTSITGGLVVAQPTATPNTVGLQEGNFGLYKIIPEGIGANHTVIDTFTSEQFKVQYTFKTGSEPDKVFCRVDGISQGLAVKTGQTQEYLEYTCTFNRNPNQNLTVEIYTLENVPKGNPLNPVSVKWDWQWPPAP